MEVLLQFTGYVLDVEEGEQDGHTSVEGIMVFLVGHDAFPVTLVSCLGNKGQHTSGGHRQRMYPSAFAEAHLKACRQVIGKVNRYVHTRVPTDLESSFISQAMREAASSEPFNLEATVQVSILSAQRYVITVRSEWFSSNITADMGHIYECYIAEYGAGRKTIGLLGANTVASAGASDHRQKKKQPL